MRPEIRKIQELMEAADYVTDAPDERLDRAPDDRSAAEVEEELGTPHPAAQPAGQHDRRDQLRRSGLRAH